VARPLRDDANRKHQIGSVVAAGGAVVSVGGLLWLLVGGGDDSSDVAVAAPLDVDGQQTELTAAERKAAAGLARALTR